MQDLKGIKNLKYVQQLTVKGLGEIPLFEMTRDYTPKDESVCPFSASCFDCPMADCVLGDYKASTVNEIPIELRGRKA